MSVAPEPVKKKKSCLVIALIVIGVLAVLYAIGTSGSSGGTSGGGTTGGSSGSSDSSSTVTCPVITEKKGSVDYGYLTITGTVKNTCSHAISYVKIGAKAFSDSGTEVGSDYTYADSHEMSANAESQFTIMIDIPSGTTKFTVSVLDWNN